MNKILLFIAFVFCTTLDAQTNYQRAYSTGYDYAVSDIEWSAIDQSYVMSGLDCTGVTLQKVDATGLPMWNRHFTVQGGNLFNLCKLAVGSDGNIYTCSQYGSESTTSGDVSYMVMAVDQWMTPLWSKVYKTESYYIYGDLDFSVLPDGNLIITESVSGHVGYIKLDLGGNLVASNMYREDLQVESKGPGFDGASFSDGSMVFTGKRENDIMVIRTDAIGNIVWTKVLNGGGNYYHTKSVLAMSDGTSIMSGFSYNAAFLMRLDANGNTMWYKEYHCGTVTYGVLFDLHQLDANSFTAVGVYNTNKILAKFNLNGQFISGIEIDTNLYNANGTAFCAINPAGQIAWPYTYYEAGPMWLYSSGLNLMSAFNSNGCGMTSTLLTEYSGAITPTELAVPIYRLPQTIIDSVVVVQSSQRVVQMQNYCWLIGMNDQTPTHDIELHVQGNPLAQGSALNFSLINFTGNFTYSIHDLNGREVASGRTNSNNGSQISVPESIAFAKGMYVLSVIADENRITQKFVVH